MPTRVTGPNERVREGERVFDGTARDEIGHRDAPASNKHISSKCSDNSFGCVTSFSSRTNGFTSNKVSGSVS